MMLTTPDGAQIEPCVNQVVPSPGNPRWEMAGPAFDELVASIRDHGVLQPIMVRSISVSETGEARYEVVCGHRRLAAATAAGLERIPAVNRILTDETAAHLQLVENLQREDLTPVDEARGYNQLMQAGVDPVEIAAKVGRSVATVYRRLGLLELPDEALAAIKTGLMPVSVGEMIGRIPGHQQRAAATETLLKKYSPREWEKEDGNERPMPAKAAAKLISEQFMSALELAPFSPDDPDLNPVAGTCAACPHRTGNARDLFGDVVSEGGEDICTNLTCWETKKVANISRELEKAAAVGMAPLSAQDQDKAWDDYGHITRKWVEADASSYETKSKTWRAALGKKAPTLYAGVNPGGELTPLYKASEARAVLAEKAAAAEAKKAAKGAAAPDPNGKNREVEEAVETESAEAIMNSIAWNSGHADVWPHVAKALAYDRLTSASPDMASRRGLEQDSLGLIPEEARRAYVERVTTQELIGVLVEHTMAGIVTCMVCDYWVDEDDKRLFADVCQACGINVEAVTSEARARVLAREEAGEGADDA